MADRVLWVPQLALNWYLLTKLTDDDDVGDVEGASHIVSASAGIWMQPFQGSPFGNCRVPNLLFRSSGATYAITAPGKSPVDPLTQPLPSPRNKH
ncbi:hypothetical protein VPNG_07872 [Cytospora leucostoma]|uniref:Uncharacterized protein n=1 Tax=Cytospora leucostoma TaxID=1230097 RepID=A0A423WGY1_9PEZI|nr:hypothetical protein VPNG_07872 [Cytospora leucostoma]